VSCGDGLGVGLLLGEGDTVVKLLLGVEVSLGPHPLPRMKVSSNGSNPINFFIIYSRKALEKANADIA
jgi:hypothetical protein